MNEEYLQILNSFGKSTVLAIQAAKDRGQLRKVIAVAHQQLDEIGAGIQKQSNVKLACREGCSFCCYLKVEVSPEEVFLIAEYIRRNLAPAQITEIKKKAKENAVEIQSLTWEEQAGRNIPCALLSEGKCSVYSVRPSVCRKFHATTVDTCKYSYDNPSDFQSKGSENPDLKAVLSFANQGIREGFRSQGFDPNMYDLNCALSEALEDSNAEIKWRAKKRAFSLKSFAKEPVGLLATPENEQQQSET